MKTTLKTAKVEFSKFEYISFAGIAMLLLTIVAGFIVR